VTGMMGLLRAELDREEPLVGIAAGAGRLVRE
jgi:hypothetical protein